MALLCSSKIFFEIGYVLGIIHLKLISSANIALKRYSKFVFEKVCMAFCYMEKGTIMNFLNFVKILNFWQVESIEF